MSKEIKVLVKPEYLIGRKFDWFDSECVERCSCGSSLFRIYNEPTNEGEYIQHVCAICNNRIGGFVNDFRKNYLTIEGEEEIVLKCVDITEEDMDDFWEEQSYTCDSTPIIIQFATFLIGRGYDVEFIEPIKLKVESEDE